MLKGITGKEDFTVSETVDGDHSHFEVVVPQDQMGIIIGKEGRTIKSLRNVLKVKATLDKKGVSLNITEKPPEA